MEILSGEKKDLYSGHPQLTDEQIDRSWTSVLLKRAIMDEVTSSSSDWIALEDLYIQVTNRLRVLRPKLNPNIEYRNAVLSLIATERCLRLEGMQIGLAAGFDPSQYPDDWRQIIVHENQ